MVRLINLGLNFYLSKQKGDYQKMYREKWEYYGGKSDAKIYAQNHLTSKVLKTDLAMYIISDDEINRTSK